MCAPDYYGVEYVINPWMEGQLGHTDSSQAQKQWKGLHDVLSAEADITLIPGQPHLPDLVFTANAGVVLGDKVIVSRFRSKERQGEEPFFKKWFEDNGFTIVPWPEDVSFEGAGDALLDRGQSIIWSGYGFRSDIKSAALLEKMLGRKLIPLRLVDPRFYHLDTCLCPLAGGYLMYFPAAFDKASQETIEKTVPADKRIMVAEADAIHFSCNAVDLNGCVFMNSASDDLQNKLHAAGFKTKTTPLTEFLKAGGAAKCLTLKLVEP